MTKPKEKNYVAIASRYAGDVVSGKILACQWTIKACQRQIDDLEKAKSKAYSKFHYNGDPILTWMFSNVVAHYDNKGNVYPKKERPENKIDGAIALIMALERAMVGGDEDDSVYNERPSFLQL